MSTEAWFTDTSSFFFSIRLICFSKNVKETSLIEPKIGMALQDQIIDNRQIDYFKLIA